MFGKLKYLKYRFDYVYAHKMNHSRPIDVMLELSSHCDLRCNYCYHSDQDNLPFNKKHMELDIALDIISQAADCGVKSLKFNYRGEATLNPNYYQITGFARAIRKGSTFIDLLANSNFNFPTEKDSIFDGLSQLTKVKVSYDSFTPYVFENQRIKSDHARVTANVDKFYNYPLRIKNETEIVIQAVRSHANKDEDIEAISKKRWPEASVSIRDVVGGRVDGFKELKKRDNSERQACRQAFARLIFTSSGDVLPCCPNITEELKYGNIKTTSLLNLYNGEKAQALRKSLKDLSAFDRNPCKNCSSFETFKGFKPSWNS